VHWVERGGKLALQSSAFACPVLHQVTINMANRQFNTVRNAENPGDAGVAACCRALTLDRTVISHDPFPFHMPGLQSDHLL
jgi:hypothetical protein